MNRKFCFVLLIALGALLHSIAYPQIQNRANVDTTQSRGSFEMNFPSMQDGSGSPSLNSGIGEVNSSAGETSAELSLYGYDLFDKAAGNLSQAEGGAFVLPANYRLGPGDRIGVYLVGNVQEAREVIVNVEGKIYVPPAGVLFVWGLQMDELNALLRRKLAQFYDNFSVDLMLLKPKNVMVSMAGEVRKPGKYVLSALNTVLDAVIVAGGPTPKGSLRDIQLIRDGSLAASVDLYQFLMSNKEAADVFLEAGDRIYVPLSQNRVTVSGEIKRPSIFELKPDGGERLTDVIQLAGGFTDLAYQDKIEISRLQASAQREVIYVDFSQIARGDSSRDLILQNEDRIRVYSRLEQIHQRTVAIYGEIRKPGVYALEDNMRLSDLILKAGNLTRKAYTAEAEIAKIDPLKPTRFLKVNLLEMNDGNNGHSDIFLEEDDQVFIRQIPEWEVGLIVEVQGEVRFPGKYSIVKDSTYLSTILKKCGGFTENAFPQEAYVLRPSTRLRFDKEFERLKNMRRDEMSDLEYQYFVMRQNSAEVKRVVVDFQKLYYDNDYNEDIILEDGDVIVVPKAPKVVNVTGSVAKQGGVTYVPDARMGFYLTKAGGATWDADVKKTKVIKVTGEVLDDEDVKSFQPGDIIWVPRKSDKNFWPVVLQSISVAAQLASIYLIVDTAINR